MSVIAHSWRIACFLAVVLLAGCAQVSGACHCDPAIANAAADEPTPVKLHRGVNLSRWWEDDRSRTLRADDIDHIRALGFDFVRLPISPTRFMNADPATLKTQLHDLHCDILSLVNKNLKVVLDLHVGMEDDDSDVALTPAQMNATVENFWRTLQPAIADLPPQRVLISIYNEPHMDDEVWWDLQGKMIAMLRKYYPHNTIVATTSPAGGWWELERFMPYKDPNLIYDVHFYEPMIFTHHGAEWLEPATGRRATDPVAYPSANTDINKNTDPAVRTYAQEKWDRTALAALVQRFAVWKKANHVEVACLEFGVYRNHVDDDSRLNWLRDIRSELEKQGIPWALWEYRGPFGLETQGGSFDESMANALGLRHSPTP